MARPRIVSWFSCGTSSAVHTKLILARYEKTHEIKIARCIVPEEHPDNDRFARDCEAWFGVMVENLKSDTYENCEAVWIDHRYMAGVGGAPCTAEMKKEPRWQLERSWQPDLQGYGFTAEESRRAMLFRQQNPEVELVTLLIDSGLSKPDCHRIVEEAGIEIPAMYRLGFSNANCIGCVKSSSASYWDRVRTHFPAVFKRRSDLSRELNVRLIRLGGGERQRLFLDELPRGIGSDGPDTAVECGLLCAEEEIVLAISPWIRAQVDLGYRPAA